MIFQVLTKRPERIGDHLPSDWEHGYPNVWLGVSVERNDYSPQLGRGRKNARVRQDAHL
ncbi:MAG: phage Gp37/Gp68 family protein [Gemmataceae bacterium]|nr:phage Gp37/Gp68 family protein [Gemmataceae bacterium]